MNTLFDVFEHTLSSVPTWTLPESEDLRRQNVKSLKVSELAVVNYLCAERVRKKKECYVEKVLELCATPPLLQTTDPATYISVCS